MPARSFHQDRGLIYESSRAGTMRLTMLAAWVPVGICLWLLTLAPRSEWEKAPLGSVAWWLLPAGLVALTLVLPAALLWVRGRYVTRVVLGSDGHLRVTTFWLWSQRTHKLRVEEIAVRRFILDRTGVAPVGIETLESLGFRLPD